MTELILVLQRNASAKLADKYRKDNPNVFSMKDVTECFSESIWDVPWHSYKPNSSIDKVINGQNFSVRINSYGFRTNEFSKHPRPGAIRIICIGGSTTLQGETNNDTYPALLERKLRDGYPDENIEVLNLGISGTPSYYWLLQNERLFEFKPDILIQYDGINDICWSHFPAYGKEHNIRKKLNRSLFFQRLFPFDPKSFDKYFSQTFQVFKFLSEEAAKNQAVYFVSSFPCPDDNLLKQPFRSYLDDDMKAWGFGIKMDYYPAYAKILSRYNGDFEAFVSQNKINAVFIHKKLTDPTCFIDICHNNLQGREMLAELFYESILPTVEDLIKKKRLKKDRN